MSNHLHREIEGLKKRILSVSAMVEESLQKAIRSLHQQDASLGQNVIDTDKQIDMLEVQVEEECLKILALHQPVAIDLRFIISILKINNDLERIGDLAANIAERSVELADGDPIAVPPMVVHMAKCAQTMLKQSIDSLVNLDRSLADTVCLADDEVDDLHSHMYVFIEDKIRSDPAKLSLWIHYLAISRYLERIADHATNIAEDVIYMIEGEISRHLI